MPQPTPATLRASSDDRFGVAFRGEAARMLFEILLTDDVSDPISRLVATDDVGLAARYAAVRNGFIVALLNDRPTRQQFKVWNAELGLLEPAAAVIDRLNGLAAAAGLRHRRELEEFIVNPLTIPDFGKTGTEFWQVASRWLDATSHLEAFDGLLQRTLWADGRLWPLVCEWLFKQNVQWPWVAVEVTIGYLRILVAVVVGRQPRPRRDNLQIADRLSTSPIDLGLKIEVGEPLREATERVRREMDRVLAELDAQRGRQTARPGRRSSSLEAYGRWFYRVAVKGESVRSVARAEFDRDVDPEGRRKDIRDGVARARELLGLTPFAFDSENCRHILLRWLAEGGERALG